jgi:uncharacterized protein (DUF1684 family)
MKYILIVLLFAQSNLFAQNFKQTIDKHRETYKADFLKENSSPLKADDLKNLNFFEADSTYKVTAKVKVLENETIFKMPTFDGSSKLFKRYAEISFQLNKKDYILYLYKSIALLNNPTYKDYLFLPFTDETNDKTTYNGGRYIDLTINDIKNNEVELDFNKAYNPYCAYSDGYKCPIPPNENNLLTAINAGEMKYLGEKKHQ